MEVAGLRERRERETPGRFPLQPTTRRGQVVNREILTIAGEAESKVTTTHSELMKGMLGSKAGVTGQRKTDHRGLQTGMTGGIVTGDEIGRHGNRGAGTRLQRKHLYLSPVLSAINRSF